ncbi:MAG TPA: glycosyltransferase 61 family protein [Rhizomicrobium sp.]|nr:glycosyltransferase 61 family protein [Rhizomicrobium sp.]
MSETEPVNEDPLGAPAPHSRIQLHFFDTEEEQDLRAKWNRLAIHAEKPAIAEVPDGLIPQYSRALMAESMDLNCVFDAENRPVASSARVRGYDEPDETSEPINLDGAARDGRAAYLLGVNARHYGHFLLETLSRAWAWSDSRHQVAIILSPPILEFARSLCSFVPGLAGHMEVIERTTRFRHVTVASPAFSISRKAYLEFKRLCEEIAERALPRRSKVAERPVYLSRAGLKPNSNRSLVGEVRLEKLLEREGFLIVHPEALPIAKQIALVNKHKWIVAPMGSACHTRLFSRTENNLLMLTSGHVNRNYVLCDLLNKGATHYAQVFRSPIADDRMPFSMKPLILDDDRLLRLLKEFGLVRASAQLDYRPAERESEVARSIEHAKRRAEQWEKRMERGAKRPNL